MDLTPLESKRPRLSSWSSTTSQQPTTLPLPHSAAHLPPPSHSQHPSAAPGYQSYPPRHPDLSSNHPSTSVPPHGMPLQHPDVDRRHHDQEPLAPMHDHYRHSQPPPPQQQPPPHSPAQPHYPSYPSRESLIKREGPDDGRRPNSGSHALDGGHGPPSHHSVPPPHPHAYSTEPQRHVSYDSAQPLPPTPGSYRHHHAPSPSMQPPQQPYESQSQPAYMSTNDQPSYSMYGPSSSVPVKKKNTRASQVLFVFPCLPNSSANALPGLRFVPSTKGKVRRNETLQDMQRPRHRVQIPRSTSQSVSLGYQDHISVLLTSGL